MLVKVIAPPLLKKDLALFEVVNDIVVVIDALTLQVTLLDFDPLLAVINCPEAILNLLDCKVSASVE